MSAGSEMHAKHARNAPALNANERFIIKLYPVVRQVAKRTGMSWKLLLAQAAQETGWGKKVLPGTNNLYNVKAYGGWHGSSKSFKVREFEGGKKVWAEAPFRVYSSHADSLNDRVAFLRGNPRYRAAGLFDAGIKGDLRKEAAALQKGHYATDPHYAAHIVELFEGATMQRALKEVQAHEAAPVSAPVTRSAAPAVRLP